MLWQPVCEEECTTGLFLGPRCDASLSLGSDGCKARRRGMVGPAGEKKRMKNLVWLVVDLAVDNQTLPWIR